MQIVHHSAGSGNAADSGEANSDGGDADGDEPAVRVLATDADTANSILAKARGLMFRRSIPDEYGLVFPFDAVGSRDLHMVFVPFAIDALWLVDGEVRKRKRLRPWFGIGWGEADTVVELPAGVADGVDVGDRIEIQE